jgi:hypothetical protein
MNSYHSSTEQRTASSSDLAAMAKSDTMVQLAIGWIPSSSISFRTRSPIVSAFFLRADLSSSSDAATVRDERIVARWGKKNKSSKKKALRIGQGGEVDEGPADPEVEEAAEEVGVQLVHDRMLR